MIGLLLVAGQTIIFLLRLVAADRRSRRRPLGSATKTVGELEEERGEQDPRDDECARDTEAGGRSDDGGPVRQ